MLIEILCGNFSRFDPATGQYLECGEKLIVSDDAIGTFVKCTKCSQQVEVPFGIETKPAKKDSAPKPPPDRASRSSSKQSSSGNDEVRKKRRKPKTGTGVEGKKRKRKPSQQPQDDGELKLAAEEPRMKSPDVMAMDFENTEVQSTLVEDGHDRCTKCGNVSKKGRCTVCHHVEQNFEKLHKDLDEIEIELVGFQRWFCRTMNEGASLGFLEYGAHIGLGILAALLIGLSIASICGIAFGVVGGVLLLLAVILAILFYIGMVYKGKQFRKNPRARLAWFQKPIWNGVLVLARAMNWQGYDSSLKGRTIIKVREKHFGDNEIADLEDIQRCQVLDLQGTSVTDRGLLELYALKHLQCLVLKRTKVTPEGVFRLQQSFPRIWIWD